MNFVIIIFLVAIFIETSILLSRHRDKLLRNSQRRKVYIDTSALIDGRILAIAETGFIGDDLIIPRSAIRELQLLADGKDSEKRSRARLGMDTANALERVISCNVTILQDELDRTPVDERLITLAKENHGLILTNDFNLNKVAKTEGIEVLNVNELAMIFREQYHQGDKIKIRITEKGTSLNQGVGHLPDGTMVVVDNAASHIKHEVEIEILKIVQSPSGKIIFAKLCGNKRSRKA